MGVIAQFVYADWTTQYPEMANVTPPAATGYFNLATTFHRNDGVGPVNDLATQTTLLYLMTAHVAALMSPRDTTGNPNTTGGIPAPQVVGRVSNATEGSVSAQIENDYPPGTAQWFQQTRWGSMYWAATAPYRTMRYMPGRQRYFGSAYPSRWG